MTTSGSSNDIRGVGGAAAECCRRETPVGRPQVDKFWLTDRRTVKVHSSHHRLLPETINFYRRWVYANLIMHRGCARGGKGERRGAVGEIRRLELCNEWKTVWIWSATKSVRWRTMQRRHITPMWHVQLLVSNAISSTSRWRTRVRVSAV